MISQGDPRSWQCEDSRKTSKKKGIPSRARGTTLDGFSNQRLIKWPRFRILDSHILVKPYLGSPDHIRRVGSTGTVEACPVRSPILQNPNPERQPLIHFHFLLLLLQRRDELDAVEKHSENTGSLSFSKKVVPIA